MAESLTRRFAGLRHPAVALSLAMCITACGQKTEGPAAAPIKVPVAKAFQQDVPVSLELVGQTQGSVDIPIRARVEGFLETQTFTEGGTVEADQLLYTIDPRPFEAKVAEIQGRVAEARTLLANSRSDLDRIRPLAEMKAVSQQDLDGAVARYEAAIGNLQAANAQLDQAEIELSYTRIRSPMDGLIGISKAKVGEFVGAPPNPVVLNFVSQIDPIRVRFAINERDYLRLAREVDDLRSARSERREQSDEGLELILSDGSLHPSRGRIVAYDAAINPTTGTFTMEADFPNSEGIVLAGQFARVRAVVEQLPDAVVIPQRAVSELQGLYRVFVVGEDGKVKLRTVTLGPRFEKLQVVESGVAPGELVAVEGLLRLTNDATVEPELVQAETDPTESSGTEG